MKNKPFTFLLCICLVFLFLFIPMMGCTGEGFPTGCTGIDMAVGLGARGLSILFPSIDSTDFAEVERKWACEELVIETYIFEGAKVYGAKDSVGSTSVTNDRCAALQVDGQTLRLGLRYSRQGKYFYLPLTEEEKARQEAGEHVQTKEVWSFKDELKGETLTITVTHDYGYENGLYSVDHTGKAFVLTEQSRVF